jgi:hypothetical protein
MKISTFRYVSGEEVQPGDRVITGHRYAVVERIARPNTAEAESFNAPAGGVFMVENVNGLCSFCFTKPIDENGKWIERSPWQYTSFVKRGSVIEVDYTTAGGAPWPYEPGPFNGGTKQDCEQAHP